MLKLAVLFLLVVWFVPAAPLATWEVDVTEDALTDETMTVLSVSGVEGDEADLVVACDGRSPEITVQYPYALKGNRLLRARVGYRIDGAAANEFRWMRPGNKWAIKKGNEAVTRSTGTRGMLAELMDGERLVFRLGKPDGSSYTTVFPIAGLADVIGELPCLGRLAKKMAAPKKERGADE